MRARHLALALTILGLSGCIVVPIPITTGTIPIGRTSADNLPPYDYIDGNGCQVVVDRETGQEFRTC